MNKQNFVIYSLLGVVMLLSCQEEFLNVKSDMSIAAPSKISDYQALLDNSTAVMNIASPHALIMVGDEEYYISSGAWHGVPVNNNGLQQKNAYIWADDVYEQEEGVDWDNAYHRILYANIVLDGLSRLTPSDSEIKEWNNAHGSALFFRAWNYYILAQAFCKPFDERAVENLGLPLRLDADVTVKVERSSLRQTYDRIIGDLLEAIRFLPDRPGISMKPSKAAAYALLAKIHLLMDQYDEALRYADMTLTIKGELVDYNELDASRTYPFTADYGQSNPEIIFYNWTSNFTIMNRLRMNVSEELLALYGESDLRRNLFFTEGTDGNTFFRGSYTGGGGYFAGLGTSEILLIRAECLARQEKTDEALSALQRLGENRHLKGQFKMKRDLNADAVLRMILDERRRELAFRGVRWEDLRRLNKDKRFAVTISRQIDERVYRLLPNDVKYVWPIPDNVIRLGGIEQNIR